MRSENSKSIRLGHEEVLFIHGVGIDIVFDDYSSPRASKGLRQGELLVSALARPFHTFGGEELYPGIFDKAAVLLHGLTMNHPFVDGNKRTALLSTIVFLALNGYDVNATQTQLVRLMRATAFGKSVPKIKSWLKRHSRPIKLIDYTQPRDRQLARKKGQLFEVFASRFWR